MTQQTVKFTRGGSSTTFGNFAPGDVLRCAAEMARHLVDEVRCAVYVQAAEKAEHIAVDDDQDPPAARRRGRPPKSTRGE